MCDSSQLDYDEYRRVCEENTDLRAERSAAIYANQQLWAFAQKSQQQIGILAVKLAQADAERDSLRKVAEQAREALGILIYERDTVGDDEPVWVLGPAFVWGAEAEDALDKALEVT